MKMNKLTTLAVMMTLALGVTACNEDKYTGVESTVAAPVATEVKVDAVEATIDNVELEPVKVAAAGAKTTPTEEVKTKENIEVKTKEEIKTKTDNKTLKMGKTVDGETYYTGTTTVTGTLEYSRDNNEEICEICFYFDEKSTKAIPRPVNDDNRPAIAIAYEDSEILGLSVDENECVTAPMALEITDFIYASGGGFSDARILKATLTGEPTVQSCS